jgi:hypothetical protein
MAAGEVGSYLSSVLFTFGGGARWLLLLLPIGLLASINGSIHLINTGADTANNMVTALASPWVLEGIGKVNYPFAFVNGLFEPVIILVGSTGAMPFMTALLMLILLTRRKLSIIGSLIATLLFASLALNAEHLFVFLWLGMAVVLAALLGIKRFRPTGEMRRTAVIWLGILVVSAVLSVVQGGFITETVRTLLGSAQGQAVDQTNVNGFSIRWPLAFYTAHLGILSIFDWRQLIVLLAELGPALLLIPLVVFFSWRSFKRGAWFIAGMGFAGLANFFFGMFFKYGVDRSITRLGQTGLWIFMILSIPVLSLLIKRRGRRMRYAIAIAYAITLVGGLVTFAIQLTVIPTPQLSYFINSVDARFSQLYWNTMAPGDMVLDRIPERSVTIFGRSPRAYTWIYISSALPEWSALINNPDPVKVARAGYRYIYMDNVWWDKLSTQGKKFLQQPCVHLVKELGDNTWSRLLDVEACK